MSQQSQLLFLLSSSYWRTKFWTLLLLKPINKPTKPSRTRLEMAVFNNTLAYDVGSLSTNTRWVFSSGWLSLWESWGNLTWISIGLLMKFCTLHSSRNACHETGIYFSVPSFLGFSELSYKLPTHFFFGGGKTWGNILVHCMCVYNHKTVGWDKYIRIK